MVAVAQAAHTWNSFRNRHRFSRSHLRSLKKIHQGKVRDIYDVDAEHLLIVTTDRLSAFDVVLPDPIPFKGRGADADLAVLVRENRATSRPTISPTCASRMSIADAQERAQLDGPRHGGEEAQCAADRGGGARLSDRLRLQGLQAARLGVRHCPAAPGCRWRSACRSPCSRRLRKRRPALTTRTSISMPSSSWSGANAPTSIRRIALDDLSIRRRARARAQHHHRRHEIRIRRRQGRQPVCSSTRR